MPFSEETINNTPALYNRIQQCVMVYRRAHQRYNDMLHGDELQELKERIWALLTDTLDYVVLNNLSDGSCPADVLHTIQYVYDLYLSAYLTNRYHFDERFYEPVMDLDAQRHEEEENNINVHDILPADHPPPPLEEAPEGPMREPLQPIVIIDLSVDSDSDSDGESNEFDMEAGQDEHNGYESDGINDGSLDYDSETDGDEDVLLSE